MKQEFTLVGVVVPRDLAVQTDVQFVSNPPMYPPSLKVGGCHYELGWPGSNYLRLRVVQSFCANFRKYLNICIIDANNF